MCTMMQDIPLELQKWVASTNIKSFSNNKYDEILET